MYQGHSQGRDSRAADKTVAMVLKEMPSKASSEGNPLLTVTTKLVSEQQESRPLLSPSIDDFLSASTCDVITCDVITRPVTSNTAVLSTGLDLVDLSEPNEKKIRKDRKSPLTIRGGSLRGQRRKKQDETELIQVEPRQTAHSVNIPCVLDKWEESLYPELSGSGKWKLKRKCSSAHSSSEFLWSTEYGSDFGTKKPFEVRTHVEVEAIPLSQGHMTEERRWRAPYLPRNHSLEEEFEQAKAAVESDTKFWDKMQAEWEELVRRNWLEDVDGEGQDLLDTSLSEKGYCFHTENPYRDWPDAFQEGQSRSQEGDLQTAVLLLEAALLQDPQDSEAWLVLGTTHAENENEQAAIVSLHRCLELQPGNLQALMALAVSLTNAGLQREACRALYSWIQHNPYYKHLLKDTPPTPQPCYKQLLQDNPCYKQLLQDNSCYKQLLLDSIPAAQLRVPHSPAQGSSLLAEVTDLFLEVAQQNPERIDPDLQTGLGVLFNLSSEFDKAVEAFTEALSVRPQDYLLWNRLGATLANGGRSEEALEAYARALELQPGYIRSRYNLGISYINLGEHREAVSNFLTALNQQRRSRSHQLMSATIWAALRIALSMIDQPELLQAACVGDLDLLMRAFSVEV